MVLAAVCTEGGDFQRCNQFYCYFKFCM